jgi:anthranilate synthase/aminodeoxychorismate synthase-like glutamine amidotransferase
MLLIDNYDSFTYNLAHLFGALGTEVTVIRNDAIDADGAERLAPSHLVISPGPGRPEDAGASVEIVRRLGRRVPTLGVCLGHQAIIEAFGGEIGQAHKLLHGKASAVSHDGRGIFAGLPDPLEGGRYHSLAATAVPKELEVCATADDGEVMAVRHRELPVALRQRRGTLHGLHVLVLRIDRRLIGQVLALELAPMPRWRRMHGQRHFLAGVQR